MWQKLIFEMNIVEHFRHEKLAKYKIKSTCSANHISGTYPVNSFSCGPSIFLNVDTNGKALKLVNFNLAPWKYK